MKKLSICIVDKDSIRAETIKETLLEDNYGVESFDSPKIALKEIFEKKFDIIFISVDASSNLFELVSKIRRFSPKSHIVAILTESKADILLMLTELSIKYYVESPVESINDILKQVTAIEADILNEEDKTSLLFSILKDSKSLASGTIPLSSPSVKNLIKNIDLISNIFSPAEADVRKIRGKLKDITYFDIVRLAGSIYKEGTFEIVNDKERGVFIIKDGAVISAFVTPGVRGIKAFMRIAQWEKGSFTFKNEITASYNIEHDIANVDLITLCGIARRSSVWFKKMKTNLPPRDLMIEMNTKLIEKKIELNPEELDVLATVVEYKNVTDVLNQNKRLDTNIFNALISLRKKGVIEIRV